MSSVCSVFSSNRTIFFLFVLAILIFKEVSKKKIDYHKEMTVKLTADFTAVTLETGKQ